MMLYVYAFIFVFLVIFFDEVMEMRVHAKDHIKHLARHATKRMKTAGSRKAAAVENQVDLSTTPAAGVGAAGAELEGGGGGGGVNANDATAAVAAAAAEVPAASGDDVMQQLIGGIVSPPPPPPPHPLENLPSHLSGGEGEASDSNGDGDGSKTVADPTQVSENDKKFNVDAMTEALSAITGGGDASAVTVAGTGADATAGVVTPTGDNGVNAKEGGDALKADVPPAEPVAEQPAEQPPLGPEPTPAAAADATTGGDGVIDGHPRTKPPPAPTDVRVELNKSRGARVPAWVKHTAATDAPPDKGGKACPNGEASPRGTFHKCTSERTNERTIDRSNDRMNE